MLPSQIDLELIKARFEERYQQGSLAYWVTVMGFAFRDAHRAG
jgi:hypothetical protein